MFLGTVSRRVKAIASISGKVGNIIKAYCRVGFSGIGRSWICAFRSSRQLVAVESYMMCLEAGMKQLPMSFHATPTSTSPEGILALKPSFTSSNVSFFLTGTVNDMSGMLSTTCAVSLFHACPAATPLLLVSGAFAAPLAGAVGASVPASSIRRFLGTEDSPGRRGTLVEGRGGI